VEELQNPESTAQGKVQVNPNVVNGSEKTETKNVFNDQYKEGSPKVNSGEVPETQQNNNGVTSQKNGKHPNANFRKKGNGNGNGNNKKVIVNQQKKETTQDQKPQNKKYFRKNPNQRRFFNRDRDRNQNQSQQLNIAGKMVTVVVPLYNEEDSLVELSVALKKVLDGLKCTWEVLFIDDGSTDKSYQKLQEINKINSRFKCLKFKRNYGKSSALQEGFKAAKGDYVITMDADLQDDPEEIPALIAKLNEGYDLVSGWKKVRHDPFIKKHTSKIFNGVTSKMVGLKLHDYNCGLKGYVRDVVKNVKVYGEMHRYIPALAHLSGFKVTEIAVTHHERKYGKTKYGLSRFFNGLFDLITVLFTTKYIKRPLHLFGFIGVLSFLAGTGILVYLTVLKFFDATPISGRPLFFVAILMAIVGVQFFSIGLIGEMITKTTVENDNVIIDKTLGMGS